MRVLAFNASPSVLRDGDRGGTERVLGTFLAGADEAGASVHSISLWDRNIRPCEACGACAFDTPGICRIQDDAGLLLEEVRTADVLVYATPLYMCGPSATLKTFLDRHLPLLEAGVELRDGRTRHPVRAPFRPQRLVLVAVSAFPELERFGPLIAMMRAFADTLGIAFAGAVVRPYANLLPLLEASGPQVSSVMSAIRAAGREVVQEGRIVPSTLDRISQPLLTPEGFAQLVNASVARSRKEAT